MRIAVHQFKYLKHVGYVFIIKMSMKFDIVFNEDDFVWLGFLPPTSGTALVNGYDIRSDIENVRSTLGLCPQHDVLFDALTVREHLIFFAEVTIILCRTKTVSWQPNMSL